MKFTQMPLSTSRRSSHSSAFRPIFLGALHYRSTFAPVKKSPMSIAQRILLFFAILFFGAAYNLHAQTTWTGSVSTAWNTDGNWTAGVPTATADVIIPDVTNDPVLATAGAVAKSVTVQAGGLLTITAAGVLTINGPTGMRLLNQGTVQNNGTISTGSIAGQGGTDGIWNEGAFNNNSGAKIRVGSISNKLLYNSGTFSNAGTMDLVGSTNSGGLENIATFNNNAGGRIDINMIGGANLRNTGTFQNYGTISIGSIYGFYHGILNEGPFNNNTGGIINIDRARNGVALYNRGSIFTNSGKIAIGANAATSYLSFNNEATFNNTASGLITIDQPFDPTGTAISNTGINFTNAGAISVGSLGGSNTFNKGINNQKNFNNTGQIDIDRAVSAIVAGNYIFNNTGHITVGAAAGVGTVLSSDGSGTFSNSTGGTFKGTGGIAAARFANSGGILAPGTSIGAMTFTGDETFSYGSLAIEVNGAAVAGTDFDQVVVNGAATLGGALALSINYTPAVGDRVVILSATSLSGTYSAITGLPANWGVFYENNTVVLVYGSPNLPTTATTWTGAVSTNWNTAANWTAGVPTAALDAFIPDVVNDPVISATAGLAKSVNVQPGGSLTIAVTGSLTINGNFGRGIVNQGTVQNNGVITIGNVSALGASGIRNEAIFNNNAGAQINIDRAAASEAALDNVSGSFTNKGTITIGAGAASGQYGISNTATFSNTGGQIKIDRVTALALYNYTGTFTNAAGITIGANAASAVGYGIQNYAAFYNNAGGQINIDRVITTAIFNVSTFTNISAINIGANAATGSDGIGNSGVFNNNTGGHIRIDRVTSAGIYHNGTAFTNAGAITMGSLSAGNTISYGIYIDNNFNNTGGQINIDRVNVAITTNANTFNNAGAITIGAATSVATLLNSTGSGTFNNSTDGILKGAGSIAAARYVNAGGTLSPGASIGIMTFFTDVETFSNGTMAIEVNGTGVAGTDFDQVNVSFPATLGGTLALSINYTPAVGDRVVIFTALSLTGAFSTVTGLPANCEILYENKSAVLVCSSNPPTIWTGAVSTDWNTAANWTAGVPTTTLDATIPDVVNDPIISATAGLAWSVTVLPGGILTIANTGSLTLNGDLGKGIVNKGTVQNNGVITIGKVSALAASGIRNEAIFNNNTGAQININRAASSDAALNNVSGTFTNTGGITIGGDAASGQYGIYNNASFNNSSGGKIIIDQVTTAGLFNNVGDTYTNAGLITIGATAAIGARGIENYGVFKNNTGAQINIDRATSVALYNYQGSTFTNAADITIGANAASGQYGIFNYSINNAATFNNNSGGKIIIDQVTTAGLLNTTGNTFTNAGAITIGATATVGQYGIDNSGTFSNTGGQINIDRAIAAALYNYYSSTFTNTGGITIGANAASAQYGIQNYSLFYNNTGGQLRIDRVTIAAIFNINGTFTNVGIIAIGANAATGADGIDNSDEFNNNTGGQIDIDRVTSTGIYHNGTGFTNRGVITMGSLSAGNDINYGIYSENNFNNTGGQIKIDRVVTTAITAYSNTFTNAGVITIGASTSVATLLNSEGSGTFSNNTGGVFKGAGNIATARYANAGGTLAPGASIGTMIFDADETLNNNILAIEVNGNGVAGTDFDQVVVNGTATLGGTLAVAMNYTGTAGDQVTILSATAISGTFATVTGLPSYWKVTYTANAVILECEGINIWTGNVSPAWNTAGNWANGTVPAAGKNVLLPATGVVRELTITSGIATGSVEISTGRTVTINSPGSLTTTGTLINNGTIKGTGTIVNTSFTNTGTLAPGNTLGMLSITGNFVNQGAIQTEIGGTTAGTQYDQLTVSGAVTVAGTLTISTVNGFKMAAGQSFVILTGTSITGAFAAVTWPTGVTGTVTYSATAATLNIVSVLPLMLVEFSGEAKNDKAVLKWKTAEEENTAVFEIERSADGVSFMKIGTVTAIGSGAHSYSFTDETPPAGNNYYRLKMVDKDGKFTNSKSVLLKFEVKGGLQISPVPANSFVKLTIKYQSLIGQHAQIYNTTGILVANVVLTNTSIDISSWPAGIYNLKTSIGTYRFIKQ
jgi:hypothetical protein